MVSKTIEQWEREKNLMLRDPATDPTTVITEQAFDAIPLTERIGVDYQTRTDFLVANGYDLSRANYINTELSSRPL